MSKKVDPKKKRDDLVVRVLTRKKNPLSFGDIQRQYGIPKSTAYDISLRRGVYSQYGKN
jgi:hypothetical protein